MPGILFQNPGGDGASHLTYFLSRQTPRVIIVTGGDFIFPGNCPAPRKRKLQSKAVEPYPGCLCYNNQERGDSMPENSRPDKKQIHHPHDKGYKQLLSNKKTFLELIRTFVREDWVSDINENDLILVDKSYILQDFSEKEADIVYRLKTREGDVIFYVLLELQSTVDYPMPFRLLLYQAEIWRDIYNNTPKDERERRDFRLPVIRGK